MPQIELHNEDCMKVMAGMPDKSIDLAIVDPPYGFPNTSSATGRIKRYGPMHTVNELKPDSSYFELLFAKTKNQIIWGYNHLSDLLPTTTEFVFWHKHQPVKTYSDGELAWTSFNKTARYLSYPYYGAVGADPDRIHPMQKPVPVYQWLLNTYAEPGNLILDTHMGSGSSAIAAWYYGSDFIGCEVSPHYFKLAKQRIEQETRQGDMLQPHLNNTTELEH